MVDPYEVRKTLKHYVNEVMCVKTAKPDPDDRAHYPIIRDIRKHIYKAKQSNLVVATKEEMCEEKIAPTKKFSTITCWYMKNYIAISVIIIMIIMLIYLAGKKRSRCGTCMGCKAADCKVCPMCLDKPKYGRPGKKKQCCVKRKCSGI